MKCIPRDMFVPQDFLETLICYLGKGVLRDPVALPCQHVFCRQCIEEYLAGNNHCPICSETATVASIKPQLAVAELINSAPVKCPQCGWEGDYQNYEKHELKCSSPLVPCPQGCGLSIKRSQIVGHNQVCRFRRVVCKDCKAELVYEELLLHEEACPEHIIECPNHCGTKIRASERTSHLQSCQTAKSTCPFTFSGCYFAGNGEKTGEEHLKDSMLEHMKLLAGTVSKLKTRVDLMDRPGFLAPVGASPVTRCGDSPPLNIVWSNGKKAISGNKGSWAFFLSEQSIAKSFMARVRIAGLGNDGNTWKICLGLFTSKNFQVGCWEKYHNGYGYILGNGHKVHEGSPQPYGQPYEHGDIIGMEFKDGNITFYRNQKSQGVAYTKISLPAYLAVALSDSSHTVEIVDVTELE